MPKPTNIKLRGNGQKNAFTTNRLAKNKIRLKTHNKKYSFTNQHDFKLSMYPIHPPSKSPISPGKHSTTSISQLKNRYIHK